MQHSALLEVLLKEKDPGITDKYLLEKTARQYPYFSPVQFFYLQQLKQEDAAYQQQATRTGILFNNPYWLHFQLQEEEAVEVIVPKAFIEAEEPEAATIPVNETEAITAVALAQTLPEDSITDTPATEDNTALDTSAEEVIIPNEITEPVMEEPVTVAETSEATTDTIHIAEEIQETTLPITNDTEEITATAETALPAETIEDTSAEEIAQTESTIEPMKINIPAPVIPQTSGNELSFEPMHMVDYFASQGIKLSEDAQTADKLGKQLKSFTEWLKTMKKIHAPAAGVPAVNQDITVQNLAEKSNKEGEVVTEAMAEVLAQQGKAGKAVEVYKKLSLLNPSKNAYFAAKIEQLKGS
ncbi:hypothetical protein [Ferruginibacter sp.]